MTHDHYHVYSPNGFVKEFPDLGAELVFTQDRQGNYDSFWWKNPGSLRLISEQVIGIPLTQTFSPIPLTPYLERLQRVLKFLAPEHFYYPFTYQEKYFPLDLIMSPILLKNGTAERVLVMARCLPHKLSDYPEGEESMITDPGLSSHLDLQQKMVVRMAGRMRSTLAPTSELYYKIFNQIGQKIRGSLHLSTIWSQTVQLLGSFLEVDRCLICPYLTSPHGGGQETPLSLPIVAEFCEKSYPPFLGLELSIDQPGWRDALTQFEPIVLEKNLCSSRLIDGETVLIVPTTYQNQINALILLYQYDRGRDWGAIELELLQDLASQIGTAIAHATLYEELEKARSEAETLSQVKSQFLANTSHELRTPLNGIIGFLKLMIDGIVDEEEEQKECLEQAHESALHLLDIINDVLDIAKIESGRMQISLSPVRLEDVLAKVHGLTQWQRDRKNLSLEISELPTPSILVYSHYHRLLQVLLNLVGNAIKFTEKGGIVMRLDVLKKTVIFNQQEFPGFLRVSIADTGIGVPLEIQGKLFESFYQVSSDTSTRRYGGLGLGLAISQKLVEAMGGEVHFYSLGKGLGSTVTFTLLLYQEPVMISQKRGDLLELLEE